MKFYKEYISQAMVAQSEGDDVGAEAFFKEALTEAERIDPDGPRVAETLNHLGAFYEQTGRTEEAVPLIEKAASIYNKRQADNDGGWADKVKDIDHDL